MAVRRRAASPSSDLVLIVDDDRQSRELYVESLTAFGFRVTVAVNPLDALARSLFSPSLICIHLPPESSERLEFCRRVRDNPATRGVPLVAIVSAGARDAAVRARDAGVDSVLMMPCLPEYLGAEIRRVLCTARSYGIHPAGTSPTATARVDALRTRVARFKTFLKARRPERGT